MSVERIDSIYDIAALQAEQEKYISFLRESKQAIIDLNNLRITSKGSDLASFTKATTELNNAINNSNTITEKAIASKKQLTRAEIEARMANQQRTAALKNEIAESKAAVGSYDQLQAQLKRLQTEYKALSGAQRQSLQGSGLKNAINATKNQLKSLDTGIGDHQRNVGNYAKSIGGYFDNAAKRIVAYGAAYLGLNAVKDFFTGSINEALEAEKASIRFRSTLDNLGRSDAFDRLTQKAKDLASQFQYLDNDEVTGVFEKLVTYGKLSENQIDQLTPVIINFAAKTGISIGEASGVILKALEGNGKALKEYGISIKDAKTDSERFAVVMNDLGNKVQGAADAFGETTTGKIAITEQHFKDLKEEIGTGLLPVMNDLLEGVNGLLKGFQKMAADGFWDTIGNAVRGFDIWLFEGTDALKAYQKQMQEFGTASAEVKKKTIDAFKPGGVNINRSDLAPLPGFGLGQAPTNLDKPFGAGGTGDEEKQKEARKDHLQSLKESLDHEFDIYKRHQERTIQIFDEEIKDEKKTSDEKLAALDSYVTASNNLLLEEEKNRIESKERETKNEVEKLKEQLTGASANERKRINENIKITEENLQKEIINIQDEYSIKRLELLRTTGKSRQDIINEQHATEEKSLADSLKRMEDLEKNHLAQVQADLEKRAEAQQKEIDDKKNAEEEKVETIKEFGEAGLELGQTFADADITNKKNKLQEESEIISKREQAEIAAVEASTRNEQDKAAAITIIKARAAAEQAAIDQKQRQLDYKQALFEKGIAIVEILGQIGIAIAKGKFAQAALAGVALLKLIVTPVPRYKKGREFGKEETAIVGDGGVAEYIHRADGSIEKTPAVETLTHLMPKDKVYPNKQALMKELAMSTMLSNYVVNKNGGIDKADMEKMTDRIENAVNDIKITTQVITKDGWRTHNERLADYDKWVKTYIKN